MGHVAIVQRQRTGCGRNINQTYVNVVSSVREIQGDAATWVANNPDHPWSDPGFNEYIVDLTSGEADTYRNDLGYDGYLNVPKWQNETAGTGQPFAPGNFADPTNSGSTFTADVALIDDRWILEPYDGDPGVSGVHIAELDLDEGQSGGSYTIYLKMYDNAGTPSGTNAQDQKTQVAGRLMAFDFTNGVTTFSVNTNKAGTAVFPTDARWRIVGPSAEGSAVFRIYGTSIEAR